MATKLEQIAAKCCEATAEERSARNPHATFCGNRRRATASGDPVRAKTLPDPYRAQGREVPIGRRWRGAKVRRFTRLPVAPGRPCQTRSPAAANAFALTQADRSTSGPRPGSG